MIGCQSKYSSWNISIFDERVKKYGNIIFWPFLAIFWAIMIFHFVVEVARSQAGIILQKFGTLYLLLVCQHWCGKRKWSEKGHFGGKTLISPPPGALGKTMRDLKMFREVLQSSFLILGKLLWPSMLIWLRNRLKKWKKSVFWGKKSCLRPHISQDRSLKVPEIDSVLALTFVLIYMIVNMRKNEFGMSQRVKKYVNYHFWAIFGPFWQFFGLL